MGRRPDVPRYSGNDVLLGHGDRYSGVIRRSSLGFVLWRCRTSVAEPIDFLHWSSLVLL